MSCIETLSARDPCNRRNEDRNLSPVSTTAATSDPGQCCDLPASSSGASRRLAPSGKTTSDAIQQEVGREVARLLQFVFQGRRTHPAVDLEAVESTVRSARHWAGAAALSQLLLRRSLHRNSAGAGVPVAGRLITGNGGPARSSPSYAKWNCDGPIISGRVVIRITFRGTRKWTWYTAICHRACGAC